jgi:hypothetical protein
VKNEENWICLYLLKFSSSSSSTRKDVPSVFKTYNVYDYAVDFLIDSDDNDGNDEGKL